MTLRKYRLDEAFEATKRVAHLRRPQREAFDIVHTLVSKLADDIPKLSDSRMAEELRVVGYKSAYPPHLQIQLATGVGKTRLMGSIAHYLFHARQTRNILIVAPRVAILEKLEREASPNSPKYLLIDPAMGSRVNLCTRGNLEAYRPSTTMLNLFLLSPQTLTSENGRFARPDEHRGFTLRDYLQGCDDLVIFADEAHHLRASEEAAWSATLRELRPKLWLGFTATPEKNAGELLYSYTLAECLRDGQFTKSVKVWVEKREEELSDSEWDRLTVEFALQRLARKQAALAAFRRTRPDFPAIEPILLICAKDTEHAEEIGQLLKDRFRLGDDEILITHSERAKSEEDLARLIAIDAPGSRIRAVVNVFQLTEGWDVTNVYVIAPLRAMATFEGAVQSMGRGLRLPLGRRTDDPDVDSLDLVCFGRATLGEIVREATQHFGAAKLGAPSPLDVGATTDTAGENSIADSSVPVKPTRDITLTWPHLEHVLAVPSLDFNLEASSILRDNGVSGIDLEDLQTSTTDDTVSLDFGSLVRAAATNILHKCRYLDPLSDEPAVRALLERVLISLGASPDGAVRFDPVRLAMFLTAEINKRYRAQAPIYQPTQTRDTRQFGPYSWPVPKGGEKFLPRMKPDDWTRDDHWRLPIGGWSKCVHEAAAFESHGEYAVANILDNDKDVTWWLRNDPPKIQIPTPIGNFEPDFTVASATKRTITQLEIKGGYLWDGPDSKYRVKAKAARHWADLLNELGEKPRWAIAVVLDEDVGRAASFGDLLQLDAP